MSPPGLRPSSTVYRGREGWTRPLREEDVLLRRPLPLFLILYPLFSHQDSTNEYSDIPIIHTGMKKHQINSGYYYIFWGLATISVVVGQIYVGSGYRQMVNSIEKLTTEISKARI